VAGLFLIAESGLIIGMVLPGTTMLIGLGLWAGTQGGSLAGALVVAPVATVLGTHLGYLRGRAHADAPLPNWLPTWLTELVTGRGQAATMGAVACGHWTVAARLWMPRLVGRLGVPYRLFGPAVAVSGLLWASTLILLSRLLGQQVAERTGWAILLGVLVLAVAAVGVKPVRLRQG
ncbi:MAG: DedA family protein, partial [Pseudonocardiaceae bacterium]